MSKKESKLNPKLYFYIFLIFSAILYIISSIKHPAIWHIIVGWVFAFIFFIAWKFKISGPEKESTKRKLKKYV